MPKRKRQVNPDAQPGIARRHLETFSILPDSVTDLQNGHVLCVYINSAKSRTETERVIASHFSLSHVEGYSSTLVNSNLKTLVAKSLLKFKRLSNPKELEKFNEICNEPFELPPSGIGNVTDDGDGMAAEDGSRQSPGDEQSPGLHTPAKSSAGPELHTLDEPRPSTSGVSIRNSTQFLTPRKAKMKKRLNFLSASKADLIKRYKTRISELKTELKSPKRLVNQTIKRKMQQLDTRSQKMIELKAKLRGLPLARELAETKAELGKLRNAHSHLRKHRGKRKATVSVNQYRKFQEKLKNSNECLRNLEFDNLVLKESVETLEEAARSTIVKSKMDNKTYSSTTRMFVFDCIVNKVPTANVPTLIKQFHKRNGTEPDSVPQRTAVELMARELGAIAELQTAEMVIGSNDVTIGFDATTQEEIHVNSIHFTTENECVAAAVDELAGGTAEDYAQHICETVDNLSETYVHFNEDANFQETRQKMIDNITNTISDRCAANHASIRIVNSEWNKTLNELYCHLHPLDSIASSVRSALKKLEDSSGKVFGKDCVAANVILQINKMRYKNGKGDPRGFVTFLDDHNIPRGVLPRYRGNRLHILFHIAGKLIEHFDSFMLLLNSGTSCGGLRSAILQDFTSVTAKVQLQILGLLGKYLTGPWMKKFYTSSRNEINHMDGIEVVKNVLAALREAAQNPEDLILATTDFFGDDLIVDDTLKKLRDVPVEPQFGPMMTCCLQAVIAVLERQYTKYFDIVVTEKLREETASARSHNIDAEEIMGMFSASQQKSPNATMCYLSCRMRSCKNKTVSYLDNLSDQRRDAVLRKAVKLGRAQRNRRKKKQKALRAELIKREKVKIQARDTKERKKLEKKLKDSNLDSVRKDFPNLDYSKSDELQDILEGKIVGRKACHVWFEDANLVVYNAKFEKLKKTKVYKVGYWEQSEDYEDSTDYDMSMYSLAADLLHGDLVFC